MGVRNLREGDLAYAAKLTVIEGWHYTEKELGSLLRMDPDGSFIYEQGGEPVGFATSITYGRTGVLGHLVVGAKGRGRGIGKTLLKAAIDYMEGQGADSMVIFSIPDVVPLYEGFGFRVIDEISCTHLDLREVPAMPSRKDISPMTSMDLAEVLETDTGLFGDSRRKLFESILHEGPGRCFKLVKDGRIAGYIFSRPDDTGFNLGPWVSLTGEPKDAEDLFTAALSTFHPGTVYWGASFRNAEALRVVKRLPEERSWRIPLMVKGAPRYTGDVSRTFGVVGFELG